MIFNFLRKKKVNTFNYPEGILILRMFGMFGMPRKSLILSNMPGIVKHLNISKNFTFPFRG